MIQKSSRRWKQKIVEYRKKIKNEKKTKTKRNKKQKQKNKNKKKSLILLWETIIFKNNDLEKSFHFSQRKD